jgi:hypothetical protein
VRKRIYGAIALLTLAAVAACAGGNGTPNTPYPTPFNVSGGTLSTSSPQAVTLPSTTGLGVGTVTVSGSGTVAVAQSASNPSGVPVLQIAKPKLSGGPAAPAASANTPLAYVTITATSASTLNSIANLTITPTGTLPAGPYYLAFWNGTQWVTIGKPGVVNGGTITFASVTLNPAVTLASGSSFYLAVYTGQIFVTPTPPPPAPVASPSSQTLNLGVSGSITVTSGSGITITAQSSNTSVATVTASASTGTGTTATFTVTPVGVGNATITFTDPLNQTGTATVTVVNTNPSPNPSPASGTIGLGDQVTLVVPAKTGTVINATSSNSAVLSVTATATGDANGHATFTATAAGPGTATLTFTDPVNDKGTFTATVSGIKNGAFTSGLTNWSNCSYAHVAFTATVNEATPVPSPAPSQSPGSATTPIPAANLTALSAAVTPPPNDNPSPPPFVTSSAAPAAVGSSVALLGSLNDATTNVPKGEFGICQTVAVTSAAPYLSFWVWEGGENYSFKSSDQEAEVLDATGTTIQQTLFAEEHCYVHPPAESPGLVSTSNGCWPSAFGGDSSGYKDWVAGGYWYQRGPYNLSAYAGQTVTLYFGNYSYYANTTNVYSNFYYLGNVQLLPTSTLPMTVPLVRGRTFSVQLSHS